jgi:hypothetical protein
VSEKPNIALEMADFLLADTSVGLTLAGELRARFPHAKREDVYLAIAIAWTHQQAGWLADICELESLRREGRLTRKSGA